MDFEAALWNAIGLVMSNVSVGGFRWTQSVWIQDLGLVRSVL